MKFLLGGSLAILAICLVQYSLAQSNNVTWGFVQPGDTLLYRDTLRQKYSPLQVITTDIVFVGHGRITCIKATDEYQNGNGGYATLVKGGVGYNNVTIHLKSQRNHGFNFTVEIYGR